MTLRRYWRALSQIYGGIMPTKTKKMTTKENVVTLTPDVQTQIEALRQDISLLAEAVKVQTKHSVTEQTASAKAAVTEKADEAKAKYDELSTKAETHIREKPLTSMAIAVAAGMFLGAITRR
jgi:ElaB/YqjD/DUF883 family membrane-anchored ribosome-binding protein